MKSFHRRTSRPAAHPATAAVSAAAAHPGSLRVDQLLVERGLAPSRSAAQRLIESGRVIGAAGPVTKPSTLVYREDELVVLPAGDADEDRYVSRGGLKLAGALAHTGVEVSGRRCLDVGQSTGGFTDCLLQAGAVHVVGVDVGHGQLHPKLATDPRVEHFEGINARELQKSALATRHFDVIVADVSFISLTLILPQLPLLLAAGGKNTLPHAQPSASLPPEGADVDLGRPGGDMILLVKPQFEVGPAGVGRGGIVRDPALYGEVEAKLRHCCAANHLAVKDWFDSPITGGSGNREFFIHAKHEN